MTKRCDKCSMYGSIDGFGGRCFRTDIRVSCAGCCQHYVAAFEQGEVVEPDAVAKALEKINRHLDRLEQQHDEMLAMLTATMPKREYERQFTAGNIDPLQTARW